MTTDKNLPQKNKDSKRNPTDERSRTKKAFVQAENDMEKDPELEPDENEDLDEGELARKVGHP